MARMKLLKQVVDDMRQLASSIEDLCLAVYGYSEPQVEKEPEVQLDLETVRGILGNKSKLGFTKEIKQILSEFGVSKLGDLNQSNYGELLKKVEGLGNG